MGYSLMGLVWGVCPLWPELGQLGLTHLEEPPGHWALHVVAGPFCVASFCGFTSTVTSGLQGQAPKRNGQKLLPWNPPGATCTDRVGTHVFCYY